MARLNKDKLVAVKCAYCGSKFLVRFDRVLPKMYCTLHCLEADVEKIEVEEIKVEDKAA
jgi:uncharacterized OB-fold protein